MEITDIIGRIIIAALGSITFIIVLAMFVRRLLGVAIGLGRIIIAGLLGLGAEVSFESRFIWPDPNASWALVPVQIGIVLLVASVFLVIAELVLPTGTIIRPDKWVTGARNRWSRTKRYTEVTKIALHHGLLPAKKPNLAPTPQAAAERAEAGRALRLALQESGVTFVKFGQLLSTREELLPRNTWQNWPSSSKMLPPNPG